MKHSRINLTRMIGNHIRLLLMFISFLYSINAVAKTNYGLVIVDEVTSIYDGDTFRANIKGWPAIIGQRIPIRINGIDTPEIRGKCQKEKRLARLAKQKTVALLRSAQTIELQNLQRGKYFRIAADVLIDGKSLGDTLVSQGLAKVYFGGKKQSWCIN